MSEIDQFRHQCIGIATCPSAYEIVSGNNSHRSVPLYRLDEDSVQWNAKAGDLLLGGGSGESAALRISIPEAILWFTRDGWEGLDAGEDMCKAYWSMSDAFVFGDGYSKIGWHPGQSMETWLAEHVIAFILRAYPETYGRYSGLREPGKDGAIFRLPDTDSVENSL